MILRSKTLAFALSAALVGLSFWALSGFQCGWTP